MSTTTFYATGAALCLILVAGCVHIFKSVEVRDLSEPEAPFTIETPLKAHLIDGRVVVYPDGASYDGQTRTLSPIGAARVYELDLSSKSIGRAISIDSVAAMETFSGRTEWPATVSVSVLGSGLAYVGTVALAFAIFGSCPTVYAENGSLEAEMFSNSVSRLLEVRDVDRLDAGPDRSGRFTLEVRNEALETHYINHAELMEVLHNTDERAVSERHGKVLLFGEMTSPFARDRAGNDVTATLAERDDSVYRTDDRVLHATTEDDMVDYIDVSLPSPRTDSVGLFVRGRSSLISTVLLYDYMLSQGPATIDYVGIGLESISEAMALGDLYRKHMGIRVFVWDGGQWRGAGRFGTSGPVAWEERGMQIPVPPGDTLLVRLEFLADSWLLDQVLIAHRSRSAGSRPIPLAGVSGYGEAHDALAASRLADPDESYHVTMPGAIRARSSSAISPGSNSTARPSISAMSSSEDSPSRQRGICSSSKRPYAAPVGYANVRTKGAARTALSRASAALSRRAAGAVPL